MLITSPVNPQLKFARRVREGKEPDAIFVEGERLCEECLRSELSLFSTFFTPDPTPRTQVILERLRARSCHTYETSPEAFEVVSDTVNSQGVIIIAARPQWSLADIFRPTKDLFIAFDAVQDPGNVGTIMRTAEAAGVAGAVALKGSVDCFAPKTLRSAMGASFRLPIVTDVAPEQLISYCQKQGIALAATTSHTEIIYSDYDWQQPTMVIFGNEARGMHPDLLASCDVRLKIPVYPPVESLNVGAAAAAILFEAARQRRAKLSA